MSEQRFSCDHTVLNACSLVCSSAEVKYLFEGSVNWDTRLEMCLETEPQVVQRLRGVDWFPHTCLSQFVSKAIGK